MFVIKRDGREEPVHFDKITARISKLAYGLNQEFCDPCVSRPTPRFKRSGRHAPLGRARRRPFERLTRRASSCTSPLHTHGRFAPA